MNSIKRSFLLLLIVFLCVHFLCITYVVNVKQWPWLEPLGTFLVPVLKREVTPRLSTSGVIRHVIVPVHITPSNTSEIPSIKAPYVAKQENISYPNFSIKSPNFASNRSRHLFYGWQANAEFMAPTPADRLKGTIYHVTNGTYSMPHDCGWRSTLDHVFKPLPANQRADRMPCLVPLLIPDGHAFQHFIDGVLPKIIQVSHVLESDSRCKLVLHKPRDKSIYDMLRALNISESQVSYVDMGHVNNVFLSADTLIYTCNTPPLHPELWQTARRRLGAVTKLAVPIRQAYVVVITRSGCHNCGRNVLNQDEVVALLQKRYGKDLVKVFRGPYLYNETLALFGRARLVLGPHGGAMYNIMYAPAGTAVVEFMPTHPNGEMAAASKMIIWSQANLLEQDYWRVALPVVGGSDMNVDLPELQQLLDSVDHRDGYLI